MNDQLRPQIELLSKRARRAYYREREQLLAKDILQRRYSGLSSLFANAPGLGAVAETFEQAVTWGPFGKLVWAPAYYYSGMVDSGNTPTTNCRPGLVLGQIDATGQWTNYSSSATDGSQIAAGVLPIGLTMLDFLTNSGQGKVFGVIVGGPVQAAKLLNLDGQARVTMGKMFQFDDDYVQSYRSPWLTFLSKTASYQVLSSDVGTLFDNTGAAGAITFTLPVLASGYMFGFRVQANQNVTVQSSEGSNMLALNNASASSVAFSTGSQLIGGMVVVYTNPGATKWIVENRSAGTNTITVA